MTSANTVNYRIMALNGEAVGEYSTNRLCKPNHKKVLDYRPSEEFKIQSYGLDEEEEEWKGKIDNLRDFIGYLRVTKNL